MIPIFIHPSAHSSRRSPKIPAAQQIDKTNTFRMMVWLVAYYEYYCKKASYVYLHSRTSIIRRPDTLISVRWSCYQI